MVSKDTLKLLAEMLSKETDCPLFIQVSTMWLKYLNKETCGMAGASENVSCKFTNGIWKVLYSFHSSREELRQFIETILHRDEHTPVILSLNPESATKQIKENLLGVVTGRKDKKKKPMLPRSIILEDSFDYSYFMSCGDLFKEEPIIFGIEDKKEEDLPTPIGITDSQVPEPYTACDSEDLDPERLFSLISQGEDEATPIIASSQSLFFSMTSPITPEERMSNRKKRGFGFTTPGEKEESFTMLNLSEDDKTPKKIKM